MKKWKRTILQAVMALALLAHPLTACPAEAAEPAAAARLDEDGYLYYMDYGKDYYSPEIMDAMRKIGFIDPGCSVFFTHNPDGEPITCRNYDYPHYVSQEDSTLTGLNIVLHCKPEGKYESIAVADAVWCGEYDPLLQRGGPDLEGFDVKLLEVLPYQCMDGINEKGLYVSIQRVDIKKGDQPVRFPAGSSMLLRHMLDDCANVEEAVRKTETGILLPEDWQDCHVMVADASGRSVVIESRNSVISVIPSDVCTNFYLSCDDMEDSYRDGVLREDAVKMTDENLVSSDHYGYGHGYHRFVILQSQLERCQDAAKEERYTVMPESMALALLQVTAQNPFTDASGVSMTQYSAIYNISRRSVEIWPFQNYSKSFTFDVTGKRISADQ